MDINEAISRVLSAERSAAHLTIKELSAQADIPERTLIRVLKGERDINVLQIARLAPVFGLYPHEIMDSAEKLIERAERGNVPDLSTTDVATDSTATTDVSATLASADDDTMVPDMSGWSADEQAAYVVAHMDQFDIAAKKGDIEREQEAFEELP
ncbi:MAG: helix-turn-helix domain-containing protein [Bifidobacterium pseudolongum]|uniref:helix-turn-helix domain-containing protein n=1 Tax=Bifidobacterium pseudolongum TaxID=1694 RepID=UPI00102065A4|nr:helix-turn-helix transcriptional regulator [Bifidobacterium pseudolongum]MCI6772677.1 helix-turn-helix domain-containing protein [Bifidobacterium pseudolongum]